MARFWRIVAGIAGVLSLLMAAHADVVFSNLGQNDAFAVSGSEYSWYITGPDSTNPNLPDTTQWIAASFVPTADYTLTSLDLPFFHTSGTATAVFRIVTDQNGLPSTTVLGTQTLNNISGNPRIYNVSFASQAVTLSASQTYWITALPGGFDSDLSWHTNVLGENGYAGSFGDAWRADIGKSPAFRVNGTPGFGVVPEAGTAALVLPVLVLGGVIGIRRRMLSRLVTVAID